MADTAGEEDLEEDEGGLAGAEGAAFEVDLEGEEDMAGDGRVEGIIVWEDGGLIIFRGRKAWRWRHGKNYSVLARIDRDPLSGDYIHVSSSILVDHLLVGVRNPPPRTYARRYTPKVQTIHRSI